MNLNTKVTIPNTLFKQEVDEETILLDIQTQEYFSLNEIGKAIWNQLESSKTLNEIHKEMSDMFDVEANTLENDILSFIKALSEKKLIETN